MLLVEDTLLLYSMGMEVELSDHGEVQIPPELLKLLHLKKREKVLVNVKNGRLVITPKKKSGVLEIAGIYRSAKSKKKVDIDRVRDVIDYSEL